MKNNQKKNQNKGKNSFLKLKKDSRRSIGQAAYEKLDSSPYPKTQRPHKRRKPLRMSDGIKYPCITYKEGFQNSIEYQKKYQEEVILKKKKVI